MYYKCLGVVASTVFSVLCAILINFTLTGGKQISCISFEYVHRKCQEGDL